MRSLNRPPQLFAFAAGAFILALNLYLCWNLFFTEYVTHYYSVEPIFFAMSKAIRERWPDLGWWAGSAFGHPFEYTYQPLMHHIVAALSAWTGLSDARMYHVVLAAAYSLGPVGVYCLAFRLTKSLGAGFTAGVLYSVLSAGGLLSGRIAAAMGGWWYSRRLHVAIVYGEGPNVVGLALLPIAFLFLDRAMERRTVSSWAAAAISVAAVVLTNIPASLALAFGVVAYAISIPWKRWPGDWGRIAGIGATGFLLFAPWLPPSGLILNVRNVASMNPEGSMTWAKVPYLLAIPVGLGLAWVFFERLRVAHHVRFAWFFALSTIYVAMLSIRYGIDLLGQAQRLHVAMEIPMVLAVVFSMHPLIRWTRAVRWALGIGLVALCVVQAPRIHKYTRLIAANGDIEGRSETKVADWLQRNAQGDRVLVSGATSFWLNYLSDVSQVKGCCDQNVLIPVFRYFYPAITEPPTVGTVDRDPAIRWMQVVGVHYVAVSSGISTDPYRDFVHPAKFDGVLREAWRDGDDVIYEVPVATPSLVHAIAPAEVLPGDAAHGIEEKLLDTYRAAIMDRTRPLSALRWSGPSEAVISGMLPDGFLYSVQVPAHPGWSATVQGRPVPVQRDALGFMVLDPRCEGACEVTLRFTGGVERSWLRFASLFTWVILLSLWVRSRRDAPGLPHTPR